MIQSWFGLKKAMFLLMAGGVLTGCMHQGSSYSNLRQGLLQPQEVDEGERVGELPLPEELTLARAKVLALQENPSLKAIQARIESADARRRRAYSTYYPRLSLGASAQHTHRSPSTQVFGGSTFSSDNEPFENYTASLNATWLLFDGLVREYNILVAKYGVESLQAAQADAQRLLAQSVGQIFYSALLAQKRIEIARADETFNGAFLEETRKRQEQGAAARADVLNFQIRLDNARIARLEAASDYRLACILLAELMGYPDALLADGVTLIEPQEEQVLETVPTLQEATATALAERPDLVQLMADIQAAQAIIGANRGSYFPQFSLFGSYGFENPEFRFDQYDQRLLWGAQMDWELFSGFSRRYSISEAEADMTALQKDLRRQWQSIISEIRQELENLATAQDKLELQQGIYDATLLIRQDIEKAYKAGQVSLTRLNEAQRDLNVAEEGLAVTRIQLLLARENLAAAIGENLD